MPTEADDYSHVRKNVKSICANLRFDESLIPPARNEYVAWIDLMGAGRVMRVSPPKTANFLARLHMAVAIAMTNANAEVKAVPINDGVFVITPCKTTVMKMVRHALSLLGGYFISQHRPHDRFMVRSSLAYGPVYHGDTLTKGISKRKQGHYAKAFNNIAFGAPVVQAYTEERRAPPFGCVIHESATTFAPEGVRPFREEFWIWWKSHNELGRVDGMVDLPDLAKCLASDLSAHFDWMVEHRLRNGVSKEQVIGWRETTSQYFSVG